MKTVKIRFPNGILDWPARNRLPSRNEHQLLPIQYALVPVASEEWVFKQVIGGWFALPR